MTINRTERDIELPNAEDEIDDRPTTSGRLRPAVVFGLRAAALAGLVFTAVAGLDGAVDTSFVLADPEFGGNDPVQIIEPSTCCA